MKKLDPENFGRPKKGDIIFVETVRFYEEDGQPKMGFFPKERGRLIALYSKEREIRDPKTRQGTGKFETIADLVQYEKIDEQGNKAPGYHYTVCMCGFFRIYEDKSSVQEG